MPELPEVETIKRTLSPKLKGRQIRAAEVLLERMIKYPDPGQFAARIKERRIVEMSRRGKYLLLHLSGDYLLVFHLRMTGRLLFLPETAPVERHTHIIFHLGRGDQLRFHDLRTFGTIYLVRPEELGCIRGLSRIGPEPLGPEFTSAYLLQALAGRRTSLKNALLNQEIIAGLGNIYVDESLFRAGIHPSREAGSLSGDEVGRLHRAIREVLTEGIRCRGTSIRDYVDGEGRVGQFQNFLTVYGRKGKACRTCGASLEGLRIGGRSSVYCPRCQPLGTGKPGSL